jgi:hypothetical protein
MRNCAPGEATQIGSSHYAELRKFVRGLREEPLGPARIVTAAGAGGVRAAPASAARRRIGRDPEAARHVAQGSRMLILSPERPAIVSGRATRGGNNNRPVVSGYEGTGRRWWCQGK